ncbi:FecR family protein [Pedobacter rhodius]|uniref:FecR family protein n=1 Tax=Pedobacter rhodius TaxID=3004098 RepID=A0ABT4KWN9_9SPHI|nr:FecR family protein [Pedobacter sp. SJ11]MCZ4223359.1 FecR family protein [Pedobacter sp. SJ11]
MLNRIWILIGKKLSGEATADEQELLAKLLDEDPASKYQLDILEKTWVKNGGVTQKDKEVRWGKFEKKLLSAEKASPPKVRERTPLLKKYRHFIFGSLCTALILISAIAFIYLSGASDEDNKTNVIVAPMGAITKIQLSDGTKVLLNSGSKITYKKSFGANQREVFLTGEAFFDVTKDARHPFLVTTPFIRIKVLGTRFNVRAYPDDKITETTLLSGRIDLTVLKKPEKEFIVRPMEKILVKNENSKETVVTPSTDDIALITLRTVHSVANQKIPLEVQWTENILAFDEENLMDLAKRMERRYNVSISIESLALRQNKFTGQFKNETIEQALSELQSASYFHYKITKNHITLY